LIRFTELIHGKGTVSQAIKYTGEQPCEVPSRYLAFTETRRPLVFWNVTGLCNLHCNHCYLDARLMSQRTEELSTREARAFIDDLANMKIPLLMFTGGEPLVRPDFWELADHAKSKGLKTALSTNGILVTRSVVEKIQRSGIEYVGISLDGASEETHDRIRSQAGSFKKSIQALRNCVNGGVKCGVRVTVTKENFQELPKMIDLSLGLGVTRFCVYWLVPSGRGRTIYSKKKLDLQDVLGILDLLYNKARELNDGRMEILTVDAPQDGAYLLDRIRRDDTETYESALKLLQLTGDCCSAGDRVANVDPAGNVYPCQFAQLDELKLGNVRKNSFNEIWNHDRTPILTAFREKTRNLKGICKTCFYEKFCRGGCRIRAYVESGDLWAEDPLCPYISSEHKRQKETDRELIVR
jgi:radical SAM protein with 4Fe4S-binding SPASM domain